jgi:hypothetical protein
VIGKQKCNKCNILENLLDEKGIQYHCVDMTEMPNKTITYLGMYCNSFPMVLGLGFRFRVSGLGLGFRFRVYV